jgi:carbon starvation protein
MNTIVIVISSAIAYILAYRLYGKFLAKRIFNLSDDNEVPSQTKEDGVDYVPTKKPILFGHHFTTIAGLGPIVGPAIGIIWGWLPAFLWVVFGSIFMGAVHDFSTLIVSARHNGKTIGELTGNLISNRAKVIFQIIIQFLLFVVVAIFSMIVGLLFKMYPESVIPVWVQIPIALLLGRQIKNGKHVNLWALIALLLMYASIFLGIQFPIRIFPIAGSEVVTWSLILYVYVYFASTLPVQVLLQPRDYINANQLFIAMGLLVIGLFIAHPVIVAPAITPKASISDLPTIFPLLFITIACGAISGFHSLASSGTTVRQLAKESDARFIGYGSMLWESFLAVVVLMAIAGGLGMGIESETGILKGSAAFSSKYASWAAISGLDAKLSAFITGGANLLGAIGIPISIGVSMIAVFIVSFANTTLDSAVRIQRLSVQELLKGKDASKKSLFQNRYFSTFILLLAASALTFTKGNASGAMVLWPLFGTLNQLLAALGLGIISIWLIRNKKSILIGLLPMLLILSVTIWSLLISLGQFIAQKDYLLLFISIIILILTSLLIIEGSKVLISNKKK